MCSGGCVTVLQATHGWEDRHMYNLRPFENKAGKAVHQNMQDCYRKIKMLEHWVAPLEVWALSIPVFSSPSVDVTEEERIISCNHFEPGHVVNLSRVVCSKEGLVLFAKKQDSYYCASFFLFCLRPQSDIKVLFGLSSRSLSNVFPFPGLIKWKGGPELRLALLSFLNAGCAAGSWVQDKKPLIPPGLSNSQQSPGWYQPGWSRRGQLSRERVYLLYRWLHGLRCALAELTLPWVLA